VKCYDWRQQLAYRFDPDAVAPGDWPEARRHLDDCLSCRQEAVAIDPTLAFRNVAAWSPGADESESIRLAVRALRRTRQLQGDAAAAVSNAGERRRARRRIASAALFAVALSLLPSVVDRHHVDHLENAAAEPVDAPLSALRDAFSAASQIVGPSAPAIDGLDRPQARVYEWGAEDLSVVMVVDESLDV
jgi:hypothetical protein